MQTIEQLLQRVKENQHIQEEARIKVFNTTWSVMTALELMIEKCEGVKSSFAPKSFGKITVEFSNGKITSVDIEPSQYFNHIQIAWKSGKDEGDILVGSVATQEDMCKFISAIRAKLS